MNRLPHDQRLTKSRLSTFFTCPRKHYIKYTLGLRPRTEGQALRMGTAYHLGHELADEIGQEDALEELEQRYSEERPEGVTRKEWQVECMTVMAMLIGHWRHYDESRIDEVVETERSFEIPLVNPQTGYPSHTWTLAGKRDRIVRLTDGTLALQEYKTTSSDVSPESDYWSGLAHDFQVSLYWMAAQKDGFDVRDALFDVARKPSIRPKTVYERDENGDKIILDEDGERVFKQNGEPRQTGSSKKGYTPQKRKETPEEYAERLMDDIQDRPGFYFNRRLVARPSGDLAVARHDLWNAGKMLNECRKHDWWPHNWDACDRYGGCACWDLCHEGWQPRDGVPVGWRQVDDMHQELTDESDL
jgi:CRISPR/Cas system-associated exonuclease Cas4 (RecB family)